MSQSRIVIVGGGPVGITTALAFAAQRGMTVRLLDRRPFMEGSLEADQLDHRVYALSPHSRAILAELRVWERIPAARVSVVNAMHVWTDDVSAADPPTLRLSGGMPVAWIVEHRVLMHALLDTLARTDKVTTHAPSEVTEVRLAGGAGRMLHLADGTQMEADLLVGADGRQSAIRRMAGLEVVQTEYRSTAIAANFSMERPHGSVARQWFAAQQVMAWLPLGAAGDERRLMSIVWSLPEGRATDMMALDSDAFAQKVAEAGQHSLGALTLISRRDAVPLVRMEARDWCADAIALVGDAAHAVHPLAGQGLNLGIADAATLAQTVGARGALARAGDRAVLRRYARARREAAALMVNSTDGLFGLFAREDDVSKLVRRRGMAWFGKQSWLKELAVGYASKS